MALEIYEIPFSVHELFREVQENDGEMSYRIVDYNEGMSMDNIESMEFFLGAVGIADKFIEEDDGTQVILKHRKYKKKIAIDSGGLGDFFSHGFDCYWAED